MTASRLKLAAAAAALFLLTGCLTGQGPKQSGGTFIGAALGGLAGSQFGSGSGRLIAVGVGTLAGAMVGNEFGRSLDEADQLYAPRTEHVALETVPTGDSISRSNPDTGHSGTVTPTRTYRAPTGAYCREYQHTDYVGGKAENAYGTACRQPDGSWQIAG